MTRSALDPSSPPGDAAKVGRKPLKAFDRALADEIIAAVTAGRPMRRFLASDKGLPCLAVVARWRAQNPAVAAELKMPMVVSRYVRGARRLWSLALEAEISSRIIAGCSLRQVAAMPDMPCQKTLVNWSRRKAAFREGMEWSADERGANAGGADVLDDHGAGAADRLGAASLRLCHPGQATKPLPHAKREGRG